MTEPKYLPPPWGARVIGNRMARLFARNVLSMLSVRGRRTGNWFGTFPTVAPTFRELPDPADHPTFRIVNAAPV